MEVPGGLFEDSWKLGASLVSPSKDGSRTLPVQDYTRGASSSLSVGFSTAPTLTVSLYPVPDDGGGYCLLAFLL